MTCLAIHSDRSRIIPNLFGPWINFAAVDIPTGLELQFLIARNFQFQIRLKQLLVVGRYDPADIEC